jgi:hypothetical protein
MKLLIAPLAIPARLQIVLRAMIRRKFKSVG